MWLGEVKWLSQICTMRSSYADCDIQGRPFCDEGPITSCHRPTRSYSQLSPSSLSQDELSPSPRPMGMTFPGQYCFVGTSPDLTSLALAYFLSHGMLLVFLINLVSHLFIMVWIPILHNIRLRVKAPNYCSISMLRGNTRPPNFQIVVVYLHC
jgi:hypothetical protein